MESLLTGFVSSTPSFLFVVGIRAWFVYTECNRCLSFLFEFILFSIWLVRKSKQILNLRNFLVKQVCVSPRIIRFLWICRRRMSKNFCATIENSCSISLLFGLRTYVSLHRLSCMLFDLFLWRRLDWMFEFCLHLELGI